MKDPQPCILVRLENAENAIAELKDEVAQLKATLAQQIDGAKALNVMHATVEDCDEESAEEHKPAEEAVKALGSTSVNAPRCDETLEQVESAQHPGGPKNTKLMQAPIGDEEEEATEEPAHVPTGEPKLSTQVADELAQDMEDLCKQCEDPLSTMTDQEFREEHNRINSKHSESMKDMVRISWALNGIGSNEGQLDELLEERIAGNIRLIRVLVGLREEIYQNEFIREHMEIVEANAANAFGVNFMPWRKSLVTRFLEKCEAAIRAPTWDPVELTKLRKEREARLDAEEAIHAARFGRPIFDYRAMDRSLI
ncbi:hypothetical protein LTR10_000825 [Elasticomyces elasticus]|nr:hypothetical protein LTR10_000825 [Elasticomyces elasticus]KAK4979929.1 hypothetical protein LTR42_000236 [Elasticomyces elasticus]